MYPPQIPVSEERVWLQMQVVSLDTSSYLALAIGFCRLALQTDLLDVDAMLITGGNQSVTE